MSSRIKVLIGCLLVGCPLAAPAEVMESDPQYPVKVTYDSSSVYEDVTRSVSVRHQDNVVALKNIKDHDDAYYARNRVFVDKTKLIRGTTLVDPIKDAPRLVVESVLDKHVEEPPRDEISFYGFLGEVSRVGGYLSSTSAGIADYWVSNARAVFSIGNDVTLKSNHLDPPRFDYWQVAPVWQPEGILIQNFVYYGPQYEVLDRAFYYYLFGSADRIVAVTAFERLQGAILDNQPSAIQMQLNAAARALSASEVLFIEAENALQEAKGVFAASGIPNIGSSVVPFEAAQDLLRTSGLSLSVWLMLRYQWGLSDERIDEVVEKVLSIDYSSIHESTGEVSLLDSFDSLIMICRRARISAYLCEVQDVSSGGRCRNCVMDAPDPCPCSDPEADADDDGVADCFDVCAETVSGSPVDAQGCPPLIPGDFDRDGDVDRDDFETYALCVSGPAVILESGCEDRDFDQDSDVDSADFGLFQRCISGALPGDPLCLN